MDWLSCSAIFKSFFTCLNVKFQAQGRITKDSGEQSLREMRTGHCKEPPRGKKFLSADVSIRKCKFPGHSSQRRAGAHRQLSEKLQVHLGTSVSLLPFVFYSITDVKAMISGITESYAYCSTSRLIWTNPACTSLPCDLDRVCWTTRQCQNLDIGHSASCVSYTADKHQYSEILLLGSC